MLARICRPKDNPLNRDSQQGREQSKVYAYIPTSDTLGMSLAFDLPFFSCDNGVGLGVTVGMDCVENWRFVSAMKLDT